jgi:RNA polymerase-binding protein DksA
VEEAVNKRDRKRFEKKLLEERERLASSLGKLENSVLKRTQREASGDLSAYSIHAADLGTDAAEREKDLQVASAEGRRLQEIDEALRRLNDKDFGICETCGKQIEHRRLEVVPHARLCLKCQEKAERLSRT